MGNFEWESEKSFYDLPRFFAYGMTYHKFYVFGSLLNFSTCIFLKHEAVVDQ